MKMKFLNRDNSQNDSKNGDEITERCVGESIERQDDVIKRDAGVQTEDED